MTKPTRTGWLPGSVFPVCNGWYERDYSAIFGAGEIHLDLWQQQSPGDGFWYVNEPPGQINDAYYEALPWRGLARPAK